MGRFLWRMKASNSLLLEEGMLALDRKSLNEIFPHQGHSKGNVQQLPNTKRQKEKLRGDRAVFVFLLYGNNTSEEI